MSVEAMAIVLHHSQASGTAKLVLLGIANHQGDGGAWPAISTLEKYANVTRCNVKKALRQLRELGELDWEIQAGGLPSMEDRERPNLYQILVTCPPWCDRTMHHRDMRRFGGPQWPEPAQPPTTAVRSAPVSPDKRGGIVSDPPPGINPSGIPGGGIASDPGGGIASDPLTVHVTQPVAKSLPQPQTAREDATTRSKREARRRMVGDPAHPISAARAALQAAKEEQGAGVGSNGRGFFDDETPERPRHSKIPPDRPQGDETGTTETLCGDLSAVQTPDGESPQPTPESPAAGEYARFRGTA